LGQLDRALWDFNHVLQIKHHDPYSYFNRGLVHLELKQFDKAVWDFNEAIQFKPLFPEAFLQRALACFQQNNYDQAEADLDAAEKMAKGSFPGQKALPPERSDLLQNIALAREQIAKAIAG